MHPYSNYLPDMNTSREEYGIVYGIIYVEEDRPINFPYIMSSFQ